MILPNSQSAELSPATRIIIQGMTAKGRAFRPGDWAERLCGIMSTFGGDHQMRYSPHLRPLMMDGVRWKNFRYNPQARPKKENRQPQCPSHEGSIGGMS